MSKSNKKRHSPYRTRALMAARAERIVMGSIGHVENPDVLMIYGPNNMALYIDSREMCDEFIEALIAGREEAWPKAKTV